MAFFNAKKNEVLIMRNLPFVLELAVEEGTKPWGHV